MQFGITNDSANESLDTKCPAIPPTSVFPLRALQSLLARVEAGMPRMQSEPEHKSEFQIRMRTDIHRFNTHDLLNPGSTCWLQRQPC